ncbi:polysaccharide deacetylase [Candidatus Oscillochloris fontis]|uniref:polysaccharide deacetylase n=1 Tax=Candidatus Oscillochloris fontis TaxID=2496868 RepID=UPI00101DF0E4|nr:polysaccharide deacetylase [Candidatus Oscillochloris fontis]
MVIPFQIVVEARGEGYVVRAASAGRSAEAALEVPDLKGELGADGAALGQAIFAPPIRQMLMDVAQEADDAGARMQIQLRLPPAEFNTLPWEWMTLGSSTLWQPALRDDYALVRINPAVLAPPTLAVTPPLRLVIATAPGCDRQADVLGVALASEVRARRLIVDRLRDADPDALADALAEEPCHLLYLIAPALSSTRGGPARAAQPRMRLGRNIDPLALTRIIAEYPDLRMVTVAADGPESEAGVMEFAAMLHASSGVATLGLGNFEPSNAAGFCATCFGALATGEPVDLAVTYGRARLAEMAGAWGAAQLSVGNGGETLFRIGTPAPITPSAPARSSRPLRSEPRRRSKATYTPNDPVRPVRREPEADDVPLPSISIPSWLTPKVAALIVAGLILVILVSQNLSHPEPTAPPATPTPPLVVTIMPSGTVPSDMPTPTMVP